jgi:hypothetical protein
VLKENVKKSWRNVSMVSVSRTGALTNEGSVSVNGVVG